MNNLLIFAHNLILGYRGVQHKVRNNSFQIQPSEDSEKWFLSADNGYSRDYLEFLIHPLVNGIIVKTNRKVETTIAVDFATVADKFSGAEESFIYLVANEESLSQIIKDTCFPPAYYLLEQAVDFLESYPTKFRASDNGFWDYLYPEDGEGMFFRIVPFKDNNAIEFVRGQDEGEGEIFCSKEGVKLFLENQLEPWLIGNHYQVKASNTTK